MQFRHKFKFNNPLNLARTIAKNANYMAFLYSGAKYSYSGNKSFLAWDALELTNSYQDLQKNLDEKQGFYENMWFGYFAYEFNAVKEAKTLNSKIDNDELCFFKPKNLIVFEHDHNIAHYYSVSATKFNLSETASSDHDFVISNLKSNMRKSEYLAKIEEIKKNILAGNYYQVNLTRKFYGEIRAQDNFAIFCSLCQESAAPYSSFIKCAKLNIISSSPERFMHIDSSGSVNVRPIKGTISNLNPNNEHILKASSKDQAENLMIVDLMRNDLSKLAKASSVKTNSLFDIDSYRNLHHMSSSISAQKNSSSIELIASSLPPGSMTGAPKIAAMQAIQQLEQWQRGVYSGSIGYIAGDGSADFSVVIRTIIIENNYFEFQVGGGIIYDSEAEKELLETYVKAKAICNILKISEQQLDNC
ncbi:MAG: anthranilate synthase component I family protein [Rickettsiales bacterium]